MADPARPLAERLWIGGLWTLALLSCLHFAALSREVWESGFFDFPIFLGHARRLLAEGILYDPDLSRYHPSAAIYKYPPLYAVLLRPLVRSGLAEGTYFYHWLLQIGIYLVTIALAIWTFKPQTSRWFVPAALILLLNFAPFFETLAGLQLELPILTLLLLCAIFFSRGMGVLAGVALGMCVMLKVYPIFLLLYFGLRARWSVVVGCAGTMVAITLGTIWVIGPEQNARYFFEILPHITGELPSYSPENATLARQLMVWRGVDPLLAKRIAQGIFLVVLAASSLVVVRNRKLASPDLLLLEFSAFVTVMLLGLTNSWLNYQLLLAIGITCALAHVARKSFWVADGNTAFTPQRVTLLIATLLACFFTLYSPNARMLDALLSQETRDGLMDLRFLSTVLIWAALVTPMFLLPRDERSRPETARREAS